MAIQQKLHTKLVQKLILTPSLQQAIKLLPMSTLELADLLNQEMVENPLLEEVPTEELQPAEQQQAEKPSRAAGGRKRPTPGTTPTTSTSSATTWTTATGPRTPSEVKELPPIENTLSTAGSLSDHLLWQLSMQTDDDRLKEIGTRHHRQPGRRRLPGGVGRGDRRDGRVAGGGRRAGAAARPDVRSDRRCRARPAGMPVAAAAPSRPRGHADREDRHRAPAPAAEPSGPGDRPQARDVDRRSQGAHRDHPQPRSEARQPLQPEPVAVRHPRRLRRQGRGPVRRGAQRGRAAAAADQPGLPAPARQERRPAPSRTTRPAPTSRTSSARRCG